MTIHNIHPGTEEEDIINSRIERAEISLGVTRFFVAVVFKRSFSISLCVKHIVELLVWPSPWNVDFDLQIS